MVARGRDTAGGGCGGGGDVTVPDAFCPAAGPRNPGAVRPHGGRLRALHEAAVAGPPHLHPAQTDHGQGDASVSLKHFIFPHVAFQLISLIQFHIPPGASLRAQACNGVPVLAAPPALQSRALEVTFTPAVTGVIWCLVRAERGRENLYKGCVTYSCFASSQPEENGA